MSTTPTGTPSTTSRSTPAPRSRSIDRERKVVVTERAANTPTTSLVLATGCEPRRLPLADESGRPVHYLRTVEDSAALKACADRRAPGWRSSAPAGSVSRWPRRAPPVRTSPSTRARTCRCVGVLGPEVAERFAELHRSHGVDLRLGTTVTAEDLAEADVVVVGVGVVPRTALAEAAGLDVDNGVLVDDLLRTSDPRHPRRRRHRQRAAPGPRVAGSGSSTGTPRSSTARRLPRPSSAPTSPTPRLPYFFTDQYDLGMEYWGSVGPDGYDRVHDHRRLQRRLPGVVDPGRRRRRGDAGQRLGRRRRDARQRGSAPARDSATSGT